MEYTILEFGKPVLSGEHDEYHVQVAWSGYHERDESGRNVKVTLKAAKRLGSAKNEWEPAATIEFELEGSSAQWLGEALVDVASGKKTGLRKMVSP